MNAYMPADLVREANYATAHHLNPAAHLAHLYGITTRQLGQDRVIAGDVDLLRLPNSGWFARPDGPALQPGSSRLGLPADRGTE